MVQDRAVRSIRTSVPPHAPGRPARSRVQQLEAPGHRSYPCSNAPELVESPLSAGLSALPGSEIVVSILSVKVPSIETSRHALGNRLPSKQDISSSTAARATERGMTVPGEQGVGMSNTLRVWVASQPSSKDIERW